MTTLKQVKIYTDGACSGNPGPGGWGAVLIYEKTEKQLSGSAPETTNNRMEMTAVIEALKLLKTKCDIQIFTDSKYVMDGITNWIIGWKARGWKTADKKPVKNVDLWQQLDELVAGQNIKWNWVKGHNGDHYNEIADTLATGAIIR
jgi:ribonuclease HI